MLQAIRARDPAAEVFVFSARPEDTEIRHGVTALPIRREVARRFRKDAASRDAPLPARNAEHPDRVARLKTFLKSFPRIYAFLRGAVRVAESLRRLPAEAHFLARSYRSLRRIDRLLIAGGGQIGDYFGGPWGYPISLFRWCLLARLAGARVVFVSVGVEPILSPISKRLIRAALALADYRSFRDEGSRRIIEGIGARGPHRVCPDLVHGFQLSRARSIEASGPMITVGINPIPFFDARYWTEDDEATYLRYVQGLAGFASWLLDRGHRVVLFPTQIHADPLVIRDIELAIKRLGPVIGDGRLLLPEVETVEELAAALSLTDVVLASRFHGVIFSLLLDIPVFALSYYRKTDELMQSLGLGDYVLSIRDADTERLVARFPPLERNLAPVRDQISEQRREYVRALHVQYDELLGRTVDRLAGKFPDLTS
jgi:polysaccharide pyruvyl transferase WcaK-like protein